MVQKTVQHLRKPQKHARIVVKPIKCAQKPQNSAEKGRNPVKKSIEPVEPMVLEPIAPPPPQSPVISYSEACKMYYQTLSQMTLLADFGRFLGEKSEKNCIFDPKKTKN